MNTQSPVVFGLLSKAFASHQTGRYVEARQLYQAVLQIDPRQVDALHLLGLLCSDAGDDESAVRWIGQALTLNPGFAAAHVNLGLALRRLGRHEEALETYDRAIAIAPDVVEAHFNRGNLLRDMGRTQDAFESFLRVLQFQPMYADALNNCGSILWKAEKYAEAITYFDRVLAIEPGHVDAQVNKASALEKLGQLDDALKIYDRILEVEPDHVPALVNRGVVLEEKGLIPLALEHYLQAQKLSPGYADAHWNEALCRLKIGEYETGWEKYEWRWKEQRKNWIRDFKQPQWQGESLDGRTILLHAEQGFGDTLQFCRYARLVADLGARVVLEVQGSLVKLLSSLEGVSQIVAKGAELPEFDLHCPLLSLPRLLRTRVDQIPDGSAYLSAPHEILEKWQNLIPAVGRRRIGLIWATTTKGNKNLPISMLEKLIHEGNDYFCIQKGVGDGDRTVLGRFSNLFLYDKELDDFADTAALVSCMDVIVSIDTSVAHLAGALGKPVWIMLPFAADWRWMIGRDDCPWYPTARLFRQPSPNDWIPVVDHISAVLQGR
ncbi:tetratricopeptide repeat protein [Uliginosibacterium sp. 31-16]|uniref:tetratricopeptide repeat protein n=1 Tax=Uliginosibacterium sp. 31-16 TaxID=3068315 RepID=UPI00273EC6B2|nr:tetratricopeptide repeat protein [Uliginosibacterium sp. 31-16]MDP5241245.1 tetratricopeptide repeat protein [Uliginosibacterium sp. 31-16]